MSNPRTRNVAATAWLLAAAACSAGGSAEVLDFDYGTEPLLLRVGEPVDAQPGAAAGAVFTVDPALPAGLTLDVATGAITGTPTATAALDTYTVRGLLGALLLEVDVQIAVGEALPTSVTSLEAGFEVTVVAQLPMAPAKLAVAPDGRAFVTELASGVIRVVAADGTVEPNPFATVPVLTGSHRGLLGVALSPMFEADRFVYAVACTPAGGGKPDRSVLYRWTENAGVGQDQTVLLDDLPVSTINNGGALCFDQTGMLLVSIGDTEDPAAAQSDASMAGKVLRADPRDGGGPPDNPSASSHVYCKGLRNTFALTRNPEVGTIFGADNGPTDDDELNLIRPGRNYEWGAPPGSDFGAATGPLLRLWPDVVVPTGLAFRDPGDALDWPAAFDRSLYLTMYDEEIVERFEMSGSERADIDREAVFLRFRPDGTANKPLDVQRGPAGRLWILTFTAIYRVDRIR